MFRLRQRNAARLILMAGRNIRSHRLAMIILPDDPHDGAAPRDIDFLDLPDRLKTIVPAAFDGERFAEAPLLPDGIGRDDHHCALAGWPAGRIEGEGRPDLLALRRRLPSRWEGVRG